LALVALKQRADSAEKQYVLLQQGKWCFLALISACCANVRAAFVLGELKINENNKTSCLWSPAK
jgi:hypothetical protein